MTLRQHDDLASLSDAAAARQSAWSVSRAYLAVITMGQQNNQADGELVGLLPIKDVAQWEVALPCLLVMHHSVPVAEGLPSLTSVPKARASANPQSTPSPLSIALRRPSKTLLIPLWGLNPSGRPLMDMPTCRIANQQRTNSSNHKINSLNQRTNLVNQRTHSVNQHQFSHPEDQRDMV
ncbi:MAG: hypothetical protein FRX49_05212 [Trebouxia sp. A1-2]|nr:MAG: hypothetical protein FRX49_05212 [Trebouxia sp. A1-2]